MNPEMQALLEKLSKLSEADKEALKKAGFGVRSVVREKTPADLAMERGAEHIKALQQLAAEYQIGGKPMMFKGSFGIFADSRIEGTTIRQGIMDAAAKLTAPFTRGQLQKATKVSVDGKDTTLTMNQVQASVKKLVEWGNLVHVGSIGDGPRPADTFRVGKPYKPEVETEEEAEEEVEEAKPKPTGKGGKKK